MKALFLVMAVVLSGCSDVLETQQIYPVPEFMDYECKQPVIHEEMITDRPIQAEDELNYYVLEMPLRYDFAPFTYVLKGGTCTYNQKQIIGHEKYYYLDVM